MILSSGQRPTTRQASRVSVHRAITRTAIPRALHVIASFTDFLVCSLSRVSSSRSTLVDFSVLIRCRVHWRFTTHRVGPSGSSGKDHLPNRAVRHREGSRDNPSFLLPLMAAPKPLLAPSCAEYQAAQVSGFRDEATEIRNREIHT